MTSDPADSPLQRDRVDANGLTVEYLRAGDGDRLALCLHGFPDVAASMTPVLDRLADAGFTAVAPYMRGYAPTDPAPDGDYSPTALGSDAVALGEALGGRFGTDDAVLVGHDWGAVAAYAADRIDPSAFSRMATMAVPPGFEALALAYPRQLLRSWYVLFFQLPVLPERALRWRDFSLLEFLWRTWSPGWTADEAHLRAVKETFRTDDTVGNALQYYRDAAGPSLRQALDDRPPLADVPPVRTPTLVVYGEDDRCIGSALFERADDVVEDCRVLGVPDAGHFVHRERPDVVGDALVDWFDAA